jgi:hypothetical protein
MTNYETERLSNGAGQMTRCYAHSSSWWRKCCSFEMGHDGLHSWDPLSRWNHKSGIVLAAGFVPHGMGYFECHRCKNAMIEVVRFGDNIAPSGFKAKVITNSADLCFQCEEVNYDPPLKRFKSMTEYFSPFLLENKSAINNQAILKAIERMQSNIEQLRSCLLPEFRATPYRCVPGVSA